MWDHLKHLGGILLVTLMVGAAGVAFSLTAYRAIRAATTAKQWPQTEAVIVAQTKKDEVFDRHPRMTTTVRYTYTVDGKKYSGVEKREQASVADAEELLEQYPVDRVFKLHYNPADPDEAVIDTSLTAMTFLYLVIGVVGSITSIAMLVMFFRSIKPSEEES